MHIFQSFFSVTLLLPALLASAYPHSHERRMPSLVDKLELFEYPSVEPNAEATPFVTLEIGAKRVADGFTSYNVQWKAEGDTFETPAIAMAIDKDVYDTVVRALTAARTLLASGQDAENQLWIVVWRSGDHNQELESPEEPEDSSSSMDEEEEDYEHQYNN